MSELQFKKLSLDRVSYSEPWLALVSSQGLQVTEDLDYTVGVYQENELIATGSLTKNVLKMLAISDSYQGGSVFNQLISHLIGHLAEQKIFHYFVFTKPNLSYAFTSLGFKVLVETKEACLLEKGNHSITTFLAEIPQKSTEGITGALVMNANPFTNGHQFLVETASRECDQVFLFIVEADVSEFSFEERLMLAKAGTAHLSNVLVLGGDNYMVNFATFPAYFIAESAEITHYQTQLDAQLFKERIAPALKINRRYLGSEPLSPKTAIYNQSLSDVLEPEVQVKIIPRKATNSGNPISATTVRALLSQKNWERLQELVPPTTFSYLKKAYK